MSRVAPIKADELPVPPSSEVSPKDPAGTIGATISSFSQKKRTPGYVKNLASLRNMMAFVEAVAYRPGLSSPESLPAANHLATVTETLVSRMSESLVGSGGSVSPEALSGIQGAMRKVVVGIVKDLWKNGNDLSEPEVNSLSEIVVFYSQFLRNPNVETFRDLPERAEDAVRKLKTTFDGVRFSMRSDVKPEIRELWFGAKERQEKTIKDAIDRVTEKIVEGIAQESGPSPEDRKIVERSVYGTVSRTMMASVASLAYNTAAEEAIRRVQALPKEERVALTKKIKETGAGLFGIEVERISEEILSRASEVVPSLEMESDLDSQFSLEA